MNWSSLPFTKSELEQYLEEYYWTGVKVIEVRNLVHPGTVDAVKEFGYGKPLLIEVQVTDVIMVKV